MNRKGIVAFMLCFSMILSCFAGCATQPVDDTQASSAADTTAPEPTEETVPATEERLPAVSENSIRMYYDDRLDVSDLCEGDTTVEITDQQIAGSADSGVISYDADKNCLIAVGIGTAKVTVNGTAYEVTVTSAPISLFMITGHSIGAGKTGTAAQSVLCADGQAYSSYGVKLASDVTDGVGIGYSSKNKPADIDAFTSTGEGTIGEGSALAWQWNNLTGEKAWILNAAVGGTSLGSWYKGKAQYEDAVKLFQYAQAILTNEIAAGHYRLKNMAIIYHSAANFGYLENPVYDNKSGEFWYDTMWNGYKEDLAMDMDGDGKPETVQALGFVPIWTNNSIHDDKPANFYMAASDTYKDMFMASLAGRSWLTDADLAKNFPEINYETHGESVEKPASAKLIYSDGVHYIQAAYNALGMDIADNLYACLRTRNDPQSVTLTQINGNKVYDEMKLLLGKSIQIIPSVEPLSVNDLTFTVSENLELSYPCVITAKAVGTGTLTISHGDTVLTTVTITVE